MKKGYFVFVVASIVGVAVIITGLSLWKKSEDRKALIAANPPVEQLLFVKKTDGAFTPEQREAVEEFKAKILARAGLGVELTEQEKKLFALVVADNEVLLPNDEMVVNQSILKFSAEELSLIAGALKR